jgi:hypothetical protein
MAAKGVLQQEQPALRRLLEAISNGPLKEQLPLRGADTSRSDEFGQLTPGTRQFLVRSTRNVISHYRRGSGEGSAVGSRAKRNPQTH